MQLFKNDAIAQMQLLHQQGVKVDANELGRAFIGIELEDEWYNVATSRLLDL